MKSYFLLAMLLVAASLPAFYTIRKSNEEQQFAHAFSTFGLTDHGTINGGLALSSTKLATTRLNVYYVKDGEIYAQGSNISGQRGTSDINITTLTPSKVAGIDNITDIVSSRQHVVALSEFGHVYSFGDNSTGQIGLGNDLQYSSPTRVVGLEAITMVATGTKYSIGYKDNGDIWAWGASCTDEKLKLTQKPDFVPGEYYVTQALSQGDSKAVELEDCLNQDIVGINSRTPILLDTIGGIVDISIGYGHALFLNEDGTVSAFGCNLYGELGRGHNTNNADNNTVQMVEGVSEVTKIAAGDRHSLALTEYGEVLQWGFVGRSDPALQPTVIDLPGVIVDIIAGSDFSAALTEEGDVYLWGLNSGAFTDYEPDDLQEFETPRMLAQGIESLISADNVHLLVKESNNGQ